MLFYFYIMVDEENNAFKVGVSKNPACRVKQINSQNSLKMKVYQIKKFMSKQAAREYERVKVSKLNALGYTPIIGKEIFKLSNKPLKCLIEEVEKSNIIIERRNDNMNIKMRPSIREAVISLSESRKVSIADLFEDMLLCYSTQSLCLATR